MDKHQKLEAVRRKTRQRLWFTGVTLVLYFSYVLNYTESGAFLHNTVGDSAVTGSLLMFAGLIVLFLLFEGLFLLINRDGKES